MNLSYEGTFLWFDVFETDEGGVYVIDSQNEVVMKRDGPKLEVVEDKEEEVEVMEAAIQEQLFMLRKN